MFHKRQEVLTEVFLFARVSQRQALSKIRKNQATVHMLTAIKIRVLCSFEIMPQRAWGVKVTHSKTQGSTNTDVLAAAAFCRDLST